MEVSKWLEIQVLLSAEEMETLFTHLNSALGAFHIYLTGVVTALGEGEVPQGAFLESYRLYVMALQSGQLPGNGEYFSSVFSLSPDLLSILKVGDNRQLRRLIKPSVQLQPHSMGYSQEDGKFYSMVYGPDSIAWGVQFSYPQLFLDPATKEVLKVTESPEFPNTVFFRHMQRWVRHHTIPTPLQTPGGPVNLPVRLGKQCLSWINRHPQFKNRFEVRSA